MTSLPEEDAVPVTADQIFSVDFRFPISRVESSPRWAVIGAHKLANRIDAEIYCDMFGIQHGPPDYSDWVYWAREALKAARHRSWRRVDAFAVESWRCLRVEIWRMGMTAR